jgi:hypothetical protein
MIKELSTTPTRLKESRFSIGSLHQNKKGFYEIVAINYPHAKIRYQDGSETLCNLTALQRIESNILNS